MLTVWTLFIHTWCYVMSFFFSFASSSYVRYWIMWGQMGTTKLLVVAFYWCPGEQAFSILDDNLMWRRRQRKISVKRTRCEYTHFVTITICKISRIEMEKNDGRRSNFNFYSRWERKIWIFRSFQKLNLSNRNETIEIKIPWKLNKCWDKLFYWTTSSWGVVQSVDENIVNN